MDLGKLTTTLAQAEAEWTRFNAEVAELERVWEGLDGRHDFRADQQREVLRPKLAAALAERAERQTVLNALREVEAIATYLFPIWRALDADVRAQVKAITGTIEVPDRRSMLKLWGDGRQLEQLRQVLYEVTELPELARPFDALDAVKYFWHQQSIDRDRVWTHHLSRLTVPRRLRRCGHHRPRVCTNCRRPRPHCRPEPTKRSTS